MPTVTELSDPYANFMLAPRRGPDVCPDCCNLTAGYGRCYACAHGGRWLAAMLPISYSVAGEQLHHALLGYKRLTGTPARRLTLQLAAVLWRHLAVHEACLARAARVDSFPLVTTVPSSHTATEAPHPLAQIAGELVAPTRARHRLLLRRTAAAAEPHQFSIERYVAAQPLHGEPVLLLDDTWTTGANAQSAAAALRTAGSGPVATLVIGRHVNRGWGPNNRVLRSIPTPFDWSGCVLCSSG